MKLSVGLAQEMIESTESKGGVVRDEGGGVGTSTSNNEGARWWVNVFEGYEWDGER